MSPATVSSSELPPKVASGQGRKTTTNCLSIYKASILLVRLL